MTGLREMECEEATGAIRLVGEALVPRPCRAELRSNLADARSNQLKASSGSVPSSPGIEQQRGARGYPLKILGGGASLGTMLRSAAPLLLTAILLKGCSDSEPSKGSSAPSTTDGGNGGGFGATTETGATTQTANTSGSNTSGSNTTTSANATTTANTTNATNAVSGTNAGTNAMTSATASTVTGWTGGATSSSGNAGATTTGGGAGGGTSSGSGTTGGGNPSPHDVFGSCRFHFGAIDQFARDNPGIRAELDFFTPGWMGLADSFDQTYVCDDTAPGGPLEGLVPVVVAYVAAFYAKRHNGLNDCNVGSPDLCTHGALFIKQNLANILEVYRSYAQGYAACYGTTRSIVFEMEPDWYQYTYDSQTERMTPNEAGSIMSQFVGAIREHLPNAVFSMDISPWVAPDNGADHGANWFTNFDMSLFTFVHTSGGGTDASNAKIRSSNNMTWSGVRAASGKPVLADTGYGVNGSSAGHDSNWDNPAYINQRIADGVISISQYNPNSNWGETIAQIRDQLAPPAGCE